MRPDCNFCNTEVDKREEKRDKIHTKGEKMGRNRICFTSSSIIVLIVLFGSNEGVRAKRPTIYPEGELVIQEGEKLMIVCKGERGGRVNFTTQKLTVPVEQSNFTVSYDENSNTATFIRPAAKGEDAGWYACAADDVEVRNDEQTVEHPGEDVSWLYVYVKTSQPFAVMDPLYDFIPPAVAGGDAVIPCRPTSPELNVTLHTESSPGGVSEQPPFDPKIGFTLKNVQKRQSGENFRCEASGFDDDTFWPVYSMHVADPNPLQKPRIDQEAARHVVSGQNLSLHCSISVPQGTMFSLVWEPPASIPQERFVHKPVQKTQGRDIWETVLTVTNVEKGDAGEYICTADPALGVRARSSINIKVWDPDYKYINISLKGGNEPIYLSAKDTAQWAILIDTYPEQFELTWLNEDGNEIFTNETDPRSRCSHKATGTHHVFRISDLVAEDTGNYTIHVRTSEGESNIALSLTVKGEPIIQLANVGEYYAPGQEAVFTSNIIASPLPNVTWSYIEYPDFPSKEKSQLIPILNFTTQRKKESRFHLKSVSNITINATGHLKCKVCNEVDCTEVTQLIFVSDVNGFFGINSPDVVTQGDDINITCGASVYNFTEKITWKPNDTSKQADFDSGRIHVIKRNTTFTMQSILEIRNVRTSDSGDYLCEAVNKDGNTETLYHSLLVEDARAPTVDTNMNGSEISIVSKKDKDKGITLKCSADGRPAPKLTWHKNSEQLGPSNQYKFSDNNSILEIAYFLDGDSGRYLCNASNRVSQTTKYMDIQVAGKSQTQNNVIWISLICVLIVIIVIVITYMGIRVHRERVLRKELLEAGLTHFEEGALECLNPDLTVDDQAELLPYDKKWEFPRELLKLGKQLGSGAFGVVMKAEARGICVEGELTTVAVKMVRRSADPSYMKALSSELKIMIHLGRHLNVVNLLGACTKTILTKRELYVIVEYCRFGNLHNYLQRHRASFVNQIDSSTQKIDPNIGAERLARSESVGSQNRLKYAALSFSRSVSIKSSDSNSGNELVDYRQGTDFVDINMSPDGGVLSNNSIQPGWRSNYRGDYKDHNLKPICTQDLLCWAWQVSRGMDYLSARNVLHGDLAARNILLADDNIVKICDFGLAKNMYKDNNYKKQGDGPLPIKWMAIESIRDRIFSTQSDIWSFGIVLWEFFTLARTPYPGMEAEKQYDKLIEGYRMEKPEYATDEIYDFMLQCWKAKPSLRPTFPELAEKMGTLLNDSITMHYLDLNTPYMHMNTAALENGQNDYLTMMSSPTHDYHNAPDPTVEVHRPDSAYLSMSPLSKTNEPGIFSPRSDSELEESHFEFPPPSKNSPINSDSEDCVEGVKEATNEDPYMKPIDVQQRRAEFVKQSRQQTPIERDSGYCNVTNNPHFKNLNNIKPSDVVQENFDKTQNSNDVQKNNNKLISPIIHGQDNYVNMPQQKNDRLKDSTVVDSFSNPSYVIMSKLENERQFV